MANKTIDQVKEEIRDLKVQVEAEIDVSDEVKYSDTDIEKLLKKLPKVMFNAAQEIVLRLIDYKEAKRNLGKTKAVAMMNAKNRKDAESLTAQKDREAWATNQPEVEEAEINLINTEAEYKIAEYRFQMLDNLYTGIKKLVAMRVEQNKAQDRAER